MTQHPRVRKTLSAIATAFAGTTLFLATPGQAGAEPAMPQAQATATGAAVAMNLHLLPAMRAAGSVLGQPYRWGGSAPGGFDCSGLVMWSFGHAGRSLPHSSGAQRAAATPVAPEEARAGDLVFFGSPTHHVGIYMGDGQMVHAPNSRGSVRIDSVDSMGSAPNFGRIK